MNETEKRLRIYRALTANPEWVEILRDALSLQEREEAEYAAREYSWLGFEWFEVHANPQTLKKMVTSKVLNITFSSHSATHYKIADPELVREAIQAVSEPAPLVEREMPADLFDSIVGYPDVKTLVRYALEAEKPAHLLLSGPPSSP
ncbi:hypothetical protein ES708_05924 [subsurface metagenome]